MKSNAPWSVKGIERDARETAKEAARREGMTVGEWLNTIIYTAGDPEAAPTGGNIEGLMARDLAAAIEHLSRRIAGAEYKSAGAVEDLARSLGGVVERLQRLERSKPSDGAGAPAELAERIEALEAKATDRQRIDALRALEKAVGQVAFQFTTAQQATTNRLDAAERQLETLIGRLGAPAGDGVSAASIREALESMSERIARAESIAREAAALKTEATESVDTDFVQKTGIRLRILGDEIKRGGDQIRTVETTLSKLAQQIDAAERRSAEGVHKVAETISELRHQFSNADATDHAASRAEIEAAVSEIAQRTEDRIGMLQRSFDDLARRLDTGPGRAMTKAEAAPLLATPAPRATAPAPEADGFDDELDAAFAALDAPNSAAGFAPVATAPEPATPAAAAAPESADDEFGFELESDRSFADAPEVTDEGLDADTNDVLAEIRQAFGMETAPQSATASAADEEAEIDAAVADELPPIPQARDAGTPPLPQSQADYLKAARLAAREAAAKAAAEVGTDRKKTLTPKQRAILAARIKRRKAEEEHARLAVNETPLAAPVAAPAVFDEPAAKSSIKSRVAAAVEKMKARAPKKGEASIPEAEKEGDETAEAPGAGRNPNLIAAASGTFKKFRALPFSGGMMGLAGAILLLLVALVFFMKDFTGRGKALKSPAAPVVAAPEAPSAGPAVRDSQTPSAADLVRPRQLYLDNIAALKSAETDADARTAVAKIEEAAALGHPPAQLQIGELHKIGQLYNKDLSVARQWFERAANGGNVLAMHRLGVMAARGEGGPVDPKVSIAWFEKAAAFGLLDSQYNLGATFHPTGDAATGVHNAALAYYWYSIAAKNGDAQAAELAAGMAATLSPAEKEAKDAEIAAWAAQTPDPIANEIAPST